MQRQPTPLIGREREVRAVCDVLLRDAVRLVTLTGPGGVGKTRVGVEVAGRLLGAFPDGVVFVGLAPIGDPALVIPTIAQAVGLRDAGSRSVLETLQEYLREKRLLFVLDNFEQILPAPPEIADLLANSPDLKVLATSRAPLHVRGEREYPVPPLPLPDASEAEQRSALDNLATNPAVSLFVQRATDVRPDFELTDENAPVVAGICRRLDGLPLAIELAAARVKLLAPRALLVRLERRLPLLTGGPRDLPERQRTLRDAIAWSYDLLDASERRLFRHLAVFVGGFTIAAADAVRDAAEVGDLDAFDGIASLLDKSLLQQEGGADGEPRFSMLETIREYGLEQLRAADEEAAARRSHLQWLDYLAEHTQARFRGPDGPVWLNRLAVELDNVRAALAWSLNERTPTGVREGLRLAADLFPVWLNYDLFAEGRWWLEQLLAVDHQLQQSDTSAETDSPGASGGAAAPRRLESHLFGDHPRVSALNTLCVLEQQVGNVERATTIGREALDVARRMGDRRGHAHALNAHAVALRSAGAYEHSIAQLNECLQISREIDDAFSIWRALSQIGETLLRLGEEVRAQSILEESLTVARSMQYAWAIAQALRQLAELARRRGDLERAQSLLEESLGWWSRFQASRVRRWSLLDLGQIALARHDVPGAVGPLAESLTLCNAAGDRHAIARCLESLARAATIDLTNGRAVTAAHLLGAAAGLREAMGFPLEPTLRPGVESTRAIVVDSLGEHASTLDFAEGRALPLARVVAVGLDLAEQLQKAAVHRHLAPESRPDVPTVSATGRGAVLTPREREVAVLVARGYSNRRIAEALVIVEKTAEVHARNIREKLGLGTRAQIAAWAAQNGLLPVTIDPSPTP